MALSDPTGTIATALATVPAEPAAELVQRLAAAATEHEVTRIVVGLPIRMDGRRGPEAKAAAQLADELRAATKLPVETMDERLTSVAAERSLIDAGMKRGKRRQTVDRVAATILLQSYLDRMKAPKRSAL